MIYHPPILLYTYNTFALRGNADTTDNATTHVQRRSDQYCYHHHPTIYLDYIIRPLLYFVPSLPPIDSTSNTTHTLISHPKSYTTPLAYYIYHKSHRRNTAEEGTVVAWTHGPAVATLATNQQPKHNRPLLAIDIDLDVYKRFRPRNEIRVRPAPQVRVNTVQLENMTTYCNIFYIT